MLLHTKKAKEWGEEWRGRERFLLTAETWVQLCLRLIHPSQFYEPIKFCFTPAWIRFSSLAPERIMTETSRKCSKYLCFGKCLYFVLILKQ